MELINNLVKVQASDKSPLWRKIMKKISLILAVVSATATLAMNANVTPVVAEEKTETAVEYLERSLEDQGTSVVAELQEQKAEYQARLLVETEQSKKTQLNNLIDNTERLIEDYQRETATAKAMATVVETPEPSFAEPTYIPKDTDVFFYENSVSSVVAYFHANEYDLAAELLTHARFNDTLGSLYSPINTGSLYESTVFNGVCQSDTVYGADNFEKSDKVTDMDLYYSLHGFRFAKFQNGEVLTLYDRYDYAFEGDYDVIDNVPIKVMYLAQERGVITPFNVIIETRLSGDGENRQDESFPRIAYMDGEYHVYNGSCSSTCVGGHEESNRTPFGTHGDGDGDGLCDGCELRLSDPIPQEKTVWDNVIADVKTSFIDAYESAKAGVIAILDACGVGCSGSLGGTVGAGSALFVGVLLFKKKKEN